MELNLQIILRMMVLPDNEINKLFLDSQNKLWIATPKGIAQYAKNGFISYSFSQD
jgi:ligand-binding sensor domain-containing protein